MTSTISSKGQTVVPKKLRDQLHLEPGTTLDWQEKGGVIRVVKLERPKQSGFLRALKRLGVTPAPRKTDKVQYTS